MTEKELRHKLVDCATSFLGAQRYDKKHRAIIDAYNSYLPHPRGYAMTLAADWCAAFITACAVQTELTDIFPIECSCTLQIEQLKKMGAWVEDDAYRPQIGDLLYYDWEDDGVGDNTGKPNHVGIVAFVFDDSICVIEGNKGSKSEVGYRSVSINGRYIRGYGTPNYASIACDPVFSHDTPPKSETPVYTIEPPILRLGATGEPTRALQALLNLRMKLFLAKDSSFGPKTERAVISFQIKYNLEVDGIVGPETWSKLING